jgi:hypothetical protein
MKHTVKEADYTIRSAIRFLDRKRRQSIAFPYSERKWLQDIVDELRDSGLDLWTSEDEENGFFMVYGRP